MPRLRVEERIAADSIGATLGTVVEQHDDGSRPSMHDLAFTTSDGTTAAVEVTAAADSNSIELWKLVNGSDERWIVPGLHGGWIVALQPNARANRLIRDLPDLLLELEARGITSVRPLPWGPTTPADKRAQSLGIVSGDQGDTAFPGSIYLTIERASELTGGIRDAGGAQVAPWVRDFLTAPSQADVLVKLERSGADQRHAFIVLPGFTTAPFAVVDMLMREIDEVAPTTRLVLPDQVTHVWLMTSWVVGSGLRWSPEGGWSRFRRQFDAHEARPDGS
ncbi:hypothetical protein [Pseudokineococcus sp. 1T1Z-3]|uniref:hypothetical protein n=1 Tax=Pseudokineococcus sp. 1T1Z-3 TaxID=3132745 RepID=UPI0030A8396F